jgi:hypothetical protein
VLLVEGMTLSRISTTAWSCDRGFKRLRSAPIHEVRSCSPPNRRFEVLPIKVLAAAAALMLAIAETLNERKKGTK